MNTPTIKQLQKEIALNRNEAAYKQLFVGFYDQLQRFACGILHSPAEAEEAVSDVMLKVWTMKEKLLEVENLKGLLYTAVRNTALNYLEKNRKYNRCQAIDDDCENIRCYAGTPEDTCIKAGGKILLQKVVLSLPEKCRVVYLLVREEGYTYIEAAAILDISVNTVDRHLSNAVKKIVAALGTHFETKESRQKKVVVPVGSWRQMPVLERLSAPNNQAWSGSYT